VRSATLAHTLGATMRVAIKIASKKPIS